MSSSTILEQTSQAAQGTVPENVEELTAALFYGNLFNWCLLGILICQIYYYYQNYRTKDRKRVKIVAASSFILEVIQTALVTRDAHLMFCSLWGEPNVLLQLGLLWLTMPIMGSLMSFIAHGFYSWRLLLITKKKWVPGCVMLISTAQLAGGLATGIKCLKITDVRELSKVFEPVTVWLVGTALADILIASCMVYFLLKSRTGFAKTDTIITQILKLTVESGFACATIAVVDLILYLGFQDQNWHLCTAMIISKVYANSLLVVLNSRKNLTPSGKQLSEDFHTVQLSSQQQINNHQQTYVNSLRPGKLGGAINVSVAREVHRDNNAVHIPMVDIKESPNGSDGEYQDGILKSNRDVYPLP